MSRKLERALAADAGAVHDLLTQCGKAMSTAGFDNWNPPASLERITSDINEREVYVVREDS